VDVAVSVGVSVGVAEGTVAVFVGDNVIVGVLLGSGATVPGCDPVYAAAVAQAVSRRQKAVGSSQWSVERRAWSVKRERRSPVRLLTTSRDF